MRRKRLPFTYRDGTATFIAYVPGFKGKARKKETHRDVTTDEAWRLYAAFIDRVKGKRTPGSPLFAEFIERRWVDLIGNWGETQVKNNWYLVGSRLLPAFGHLRLAAIGDAELQAFVHRARRDGLGPTYTNNLTKLLRTILGQAVMFRELDAVPFKKRPALREPKLKQELNREEMGAFLRAFEDREGFMEHVASKGRDAILTAKTGTVYRRRMMGLKPESDAAEESFERFRKTRLFFILSLETGIRKTDLLNLPFDAVDLDEGWISFVQGKTGEDVCIALTDAACAAVRELRSMTSGRKMYGWLAEKTLNRHFVLAKKLASITRPFRIHDCRHTFGSRLASAGTPIQIIAKSLGHTDTRMAAQRYARPSRESLRVVKEALERQGPR